MTHNEPTAVPPQHSTAWLCTTHLMLHAITAGRNIPVPACLAYSAEDPYTVYLDSHTDTAVPVTWALSRELLTAGTRRRSGAGAVSIYPGHGDDADSLYLLLAGHDGTGETDTLLLRAQAADVEAFLRWSEHIVPPGQESDHLDLDELVRQLLEHGPDA
ncbi:SsgA family sporulation/cell division regulator [Streptomyces kurssanovii]|uniref:SsgA family sporulation/cell division regulator n=1 Tax=Streptomyces kurssanovii TaxID=67312 RepID=A0ABV3HW71_9ACTN